jgi:ABC-type lipoprotein export system ATPase subunit
MGSFIEVRDLTKVYHVGEQHVEALKGINLNIEQSDFVVFMGHSGSGKTTLVSVIGGLTKPTGGTVLIEGVDIWRHSDTAMSAFRNKKIGFCFQSFSLLPSLNVMNNIIMPLIFANSERKNPEKIREKASSMLRELDMLEKITSFPSELSGGEQRRVAIVRALMNDPEIILADEPTGELDIKTEQEVIEIFRHINEEYKKTVIVVSHTLAWIEKAKKVIVMKDGMLYENIADPVTLLMGGC